VDPIALRRVSELTLGLGVTTSLAQDSESSVDPLRDLETFAGLGVNEIHLELPWSRLQPQPGRLDGQLAETYERYISHASGLGLDVWIRLHVSAEPLWFISDGGFADDRATAKWWPRWVETIAERFGDQVTGFEPISDPVGWAARWSDDPKKHSDTLLNLAIAWRDAWRILHGSTLVATDLHLRMERPSDESVEAAQAARLREFLRWNLWMRSLRDGHFVLPGRFDRQIADLGGSLDVVGITTAIDIPGSISDEALSRWRERLGTIIRRVGEEGPERPLMLSPRTAHRHAGERLAITEASAAAIVDAQRDHVPVRSVIVEPGIDSHDDGRGGGLIGRDRGVLATTELWTQFSRS
jgi:Glycosyl hydrolase family 1